MHVSFDLPIGREEGFERVFTFHGEDEDGLAEVRAKSREDGMEGFANLFELGGDAAGFAFTGIADDGEVGGTNFDPVVEVIGGGRGGGICQQQGQKDGETRDLREERAHEMFVEDSGREVKGERECHECSVVSCRF
jgi:hypothetical protein